MPNWTFCTLEAPSDVLKKYINTDEDGKPRFDFNLVIPRPEIYNDPDLVSGGHEHAAIKWYLTERGTRSPKPIVTVENKSFGKTLEQAIFSKFDFTTDISNIERYGDPDKLYEIGKKYVEAFEKYGYYDWYDWSYDNWGTKWNACSCYVDLMNDEPEYVKFDTAWCYPAPVINKIFDDNPGCYISFTWSDEDYDGTHTICRKEDGTIEMYTEWEEQEYEEQE